ncbi:MAG: hypothetical protein LBE35_07835 [Clostridiales bacterium]|jgi:hypothetical protein|nr:hypothetical protein [Clostridiales bacterium]
MGEVLGIGVFFLVAVGLMVPAIFMIRKQENAKKDEAEKYSAIYDGLFKHSEGLPLATGVMVQLFYGKEKITFKKDLQEISLELNRIIDIDTVFGKDAKGDAASGATAGAVIGGGLTGAAIGAMLATSTYLVITYEKDGEPAYILLDTAQTGLLANKIVKDFKANHQRGTAEIKL